jgi:hypothetical protein
MVSIIPPFADLGRRPDGSSRAKALRFPLATPFANSEQAYHWRTCHCPNGKKGSERAEFASPVSQDRPATRGRFVGREREPSEIRSTIDDALSARGGLLLFTGELGIGKTWLADEAAAYAGSRGMRMYWGRCFEGGVRLLIGPGFRCSAG